MSNKKECFTLTREEFKAVLMQHLEQDVTRWEEGLKMLLSPDEAALVVALRLAASGKANTTPQTGSERLAAAVNKPR